MMERGNIMSRIALLMSAIALGAVMVLAISYATGSEAAKPPPQDQTVREQNVDGNGHIAVHEQGVADVKVVSLPSATGRLIEFGRQTLEPGVASYLSPMVDVSDCGLLDVMAAMPFVPGMSVSAMLWTSPDGTTRIEMPNPGCYVGGSWGQYSLYCRVGGDHRFLQVQVYVAPNSVTREVTGWLWCIP
jgi:hypothetical protein